jgi:acylphosphatase
MGEPMIERRIVRVTGDVQGVGFRASARNEAQRRGVRGWARNEPDGSVTIDAEGEPDALAAFIAWCRHGPPAARIDQIAITSAEPVGHAGFEIARRDGGGSG